MADEQIKGIFTTKGREQIAQALEGGYTITIGSMVYGDGRSPDTPNVSQTSLIHQLGSITAIAKVEDGVWTYFEGVIPANAPDMVIREIGITNSDGELMIVVSVPDINKTTPVNGVSQRLPIRIGVTVSEGSVLTVIPDPDNVPPFTQQTLGLIKGRKADGYVAALDGTSGFGKVYGWENVLKSTSELPQGVNSDFVFDKESDISFVTTDNYFIYKKSDNTLFYAARPIQIGDVVYSDTTLTTPYGVIYGVNDTQVVINTTQVKSYSFVKFNTGSSSDPYVYYQYDFNGTDIYTSVPLATNVILYTDKGLTQQYGTVIKVDTESSVTVSLYNNFVYSGTYSINTLNLAKLENDEYGDLTLKIGSTQDRLRLATSNSFNENVGDHIQVDIEGNTTKTLMYLEDKISDTLPCTFNSGNVDSLGNADLINTTVSQNTQYVIPSTYSITVSADAYYPVTLIGGGGSGVQGLYDGIPVYDSGASGAGFVGEVYLESGDYTITVGGIAETSVLKDSNDNILISAGGGSNGILYQHGGYGGTLTIADGVQTQNVTLQTNGNNGQHANYPVSGGASVYNNYGAGANSSNKGRTDGYISVNLGAGNSNNVSYKIGGLYPQLIGTTSDKKQFIVSGLDSDDVSGLSDGTYYKYVGADGSSELLNTSFTVSKINPLIWQQPTLNSNGTLGTNNFAVKYATSSTTSYTPSDTTKAYYVFDKDDTTSLSIRKSANNTQFLESDNAGIVFYINSPIQINSLTFKQLGLSKFEIFYGDNESTWTSIGIYTCSNTANTVETITVDIDKIDSYHKYFKLIVIESNSISSNKYYVDLYGITIRGILDSNNYINSIWLNNAVSPLTVKKYIDPNYEIVDTPPTITADGIASDFSSTSFIKTPPVSFGNNYIIEGEADFDGEGAFLSLINANNKEIAFKNDIGAKKIKIYESIGYASTDISYTGTLTHISYKLSVDITNNSYTFEYEFNNSGTPQTLNLTNSNIQTILGSLSYAVLGNSGVAWTATWALNGSVDLKQFKIYVNDTLVCNPVFPNGWQPYDKIPLGKITVESGAVTGVETFPYNIDYIGSGLGYSMPSDKAISLTTPASGPIDRLIYRAPANGYFYFSSNSGTLQIGNNQAQSLGMTSTPLTGGTTLGAKVFCNVCKNQTIFISCSSTSSPPINSAYFVYACDSQSEFNENENISN